ncbi:putative Ig domain-containing protein [Lapillicoccus jejuensis]|uniref:Uncharacterized protein n=1 Tax=Lapillicoccus jejuensis TaxID=402171 RepID=A0A542E3J1_9MICO|nr:putative Ig domain-containing protein [Lapillicoccus jejuensis]TQJ09895.1 hypothetical protein FB458_3011 [Lapillicoccus jejuensis]
MSHPSIPRPAAAVAALLLLGVVGPTLSAGPACAVTATRGSLVATSLRVEGRAQPGSYVVARSTTSIAGARADRSGSYRVEASGFRAPDCRVTVSDGGGTPTATVALTGCTPSVSPVPPVPAPPTGSCVITPRAPVVLPAGRPTAFYVETTGCDTTTGSGATPTPVRWTVVAGSIPTGLTGPTVQGTTATALIGTPGVPGTYRFTLEVVDQVGAKDQETFTVTVG